MFSSEVYQSRRGALMSRLDGGILLLPGNGESPMNYADNTYPFRQDSTFLYYFGLSQPDLAAVIDLDEGAATVFGDELTIDHIVWMGDLPTIAERAARAGVTNTRPRADLTQVVKGALDAGREVHWLPPYRADTVALLASLLSVPYADVAAGASPDFIQAVVDQRNVKAPEEVAEIERAVATSVEMHSAAIRMARPGMTEADVAAEVERIAVASGGRIAFPVIATIHGEVLHNHHHENTLSQGDLFLLDSGAETAMGYAGDLSSTFPVSPRFTERQRIIYDVQLRSFARAVELLAPGVPYRDVHFAVARVIFEGLKDVGVFRGDADEALAAGAHAIVFPHGLGHMMGLDVHDMENLGESYVGYAGRERSTQFGTKSLRLARPLEPGFVLTVEPGIYFIPQLMDLWRSEGRHTAFIDYDELDRWRDFGGVRNEEDYLVTDTGARRLGPPKPMSVEDIEGMRAG
ncbi:MAG TPA: aminopeptidase P family protein [Longimicrobiales bacterium]|jgi:Xaa-Pro aminopeptidase